MTIKQLESAIEKRDYIDELAEAIKILREAKENHNTIDDAIKEYEEELTIATEELEAL